MLIRNIKDYINPGSPPTSIYINPNFEIEPIPAQLPANIKIIDAQQNLVRMQGLVDVHTHGIDGFDFSDDKEIAIDRITKALAQNGVAYCVATLVSMGIPELKSRLKALDEHVVKQQSAQQINARIIGVHLEGPFISKSCKGAHDPKVLLNEISLDLFKDIIAVAPHIDNWKITLSPDIIGAIEFIKQVKKLRLNDKPIYVSVFIGHSNADPELIRQAFEAGADGFTHLGNACDEKKHRCEQVDPHEVNSNLVKFALNHPTSYVELIVDGQHLSDAFVTLIYERHKDTIILISDALSAARAPDGDYQLGTLMVTKKTIVTQGKKVEKIVLKDDPEKLAGSAAVLPEIIEKFYSILKTLGKSADEIIDAVYLAAVRNPRATSMPKSSMLPDHNNFILLDKNTGKMVINICNGKIFLSDYFRAKHAIDMPNEWQKFFFQCNLVTSPDLERIPPDLSSRPS